MCHSRFQQIASSVITSTVLCILLPRLGTSSRLRQRSRLSSLEAAARSSGTQSNIVLGGFANVALNGAYIARLDDMHQIEAHETYWSLSGHYFLHKCNGGLWHISFKDDFDAARKGHCQGVVAYHPSSGVGRRLSDPVYGHGWKEVLEGQDDWQASQGGVIATKTACSSFQGDPGGCVESGCEWDGKMCTAHWGLWDTRNGPQFEDIAQGDLASCYFLAALSAILSSHQHVLKDMFVASHPAAKESYHAEGFAHPVYVTRWLIMGHVVKVDVDAVVPVGQSGRPSFTSCSGGRFYWASLLEKAWAKIFSNYKAVHFTDGGSISDAFSAIIQAPIKNIEHALPRHAHYSSRRNNAATTEKRLWNRMRSGTRRGYPMLGGSHPHASHVQAKHAFAVLSAEEVIVDRKLVKTVLLYDSYRTMGVRYKGELVGANVGLDIGFFRMTFREYMHDFDVTSIAEVLPDYTITSIDVPKQDELASSEFTFTMRGDRPFAIQLAWPSYRFLKSQGCARLKPEVSIQVFRGSHEVGHMRRGPVSSNGVKFWLPGAAGQYRVVASGRFENAEWLNKIYLNTYAPVSEKVEFKPHKVTMAGFKDQQWNQEYTSSLDAKYSVGGKETFWTSSGERFLFWCSTESLWMAAFKSQLPKIMAGACPGFVWGRQNRFITDTLGWKEWYDSQWNMLPSAGALAAAHRYNSSSKSSHSACLNLVNRLDMLHNWKQIKDSKGKDPYFPPDLRSIYDEDGDCSFNVTRKEKTACASYTRWRSLAAISADESP